MDDFRTGALAPRFQRCAKPNCRCAAPEQLGHGPYYILKCTKDGLPTSRSIPAQRGRPLEERKTVLWIRAIRACADVADQLARTRPVSVLDREGDVSASFAEQRRLAAVALQVRATHNRSLGPDQPKLFEQMRVQAARPARAELRWQTVGAAGSDLWRLVRHRLRGALRRSCRARSCTCEGCA
ncbi:MAG: hypothetical protein OXN89_03665 [Bryobacterales bacterium]|nr:hypothetical protein [Bryobacterales bacterium]